MIAAAAVAWKLKSINAITAIVGQKIFTGRAPEGALLPYIVVDRPPGQVNLGGTSQGQGSIVKTPVVVYCFADTKNQKGLEQADAIARLVSPALSPVSGVTGSVQWNGTWIDHVTPTDRYANIENPQDGGEVGWRAMAGAFDVFHLNCQGG